MSDDMVNEKSSLITENLLALKILDEGTKVAIFASFQNEPNTEELVNYFWAERKELCLPVTDKGSLRFYEYGSDSVLLKIDLVYLNQIQIKLKKFPFNLLILF